MRVRTSWGPIHSLYALQMDVFFLLWAHGTSSMLSIFMQFEEGPMIWQQSNIFFVYCLNCLNIEYFLKWQEPVKQGFLISFYSKEFATSSKVSTPLNFFKMYFLDTHLQTVPPTNSETYAITGQLSYPSKKTGNWLATENDLFVSKMI